MTDYNETIKQIPMPRRIAMLKVSKRGYPIPWFVPWIDGEPVTQAADPNKVRLAVRFGLCWCCGHKLGKHLAFVIGPMCAINRITAEPPSHRDCAEYALKACPFLVNPRMRRNPVEPTGDEIKSAPAGVMIERNPGVSLLWITRSYRQLKVYSGTLYKVGEPLEVQWWREGRAATRAEVLASIDSGLPLLRAADMKEDGSVPPETDAAINAEMKRVLKLVPA